MSDPTEPRALDRREFLQLLGAAGLASVLPLATPAASQTASPTVAPPTPTAAATPAAPSEDARALTALLKRRFPDRLSDSQWESIARDFEGDLGLGKRLRALKLKNSDEPDSTFKV